MQHFIFTLSIILSLSLSAQPMSIINLQGEQIEVLLCSPEKTQILIGQHRGQRDDSLIKPWTARTYRLSNQQILMEFYDGQSAVVEHEEAFHQLTDVRFVKNTIWNLKKNISYKINLPFERGRELSRSKGASRMTAYQRDFDELGDFEIYRLANQQILFLNLSPFSPLASIYPDIKTLASENRDIEEMVYGLEDEEYFMKELAKGNTLADFDPQKFLIYPQYLEAILTQHELTIREREVYTNPFWGNLYESKRGYWMLIEEVNQPNSGGDQMCILTLQIFEDRLQVRAAKAHYEQVKNQKPERVHFFQHISETYGKDFPQYVDSLILELPQLLNFNLTQLSVDDKGLAIVDEAIKWRWGKDFDFDDGFPVILAFYGEYYMRTKKVGRWELKFDPSHQVWIPQIMLNDQTNAFDVHRFYQSMLEGPIPMKQAGDYDSKIKKLKSGR
ncbi:MAG: hypothetical protein AAFO96_25595 [Bacteroidota bacterium]